MTFQTISTETCDPFTVYVTIDPGSPGDGYLQPDDLATVSIESVWDENENRIPDNLWPQVLGKDVADLEIEALTEIS